MTDNDGFALVKEAISANEREELLTRLAHQQQSRSLLDESWCRELACRLRASRLGQLLPDTAVAVQCTYFDKSEQSNWFVGYHQDLSVPVREWVACADCTGWTQKEGITFVQPPLPVLESLVSVRLHLDENTPDNGPLRIVPGSHVLGRLGPDTERIRQGRDEIVCLAPERSALVFKPLLLHASSKSRSALPRRILHFLFGPAALPHDLNWHTAI